MRKAQIMDKHPIRTSISMKKAKIMETPDPNLNVHEKGYNHGQTADPHLNIHEKGSNHGQTRFESPNPSLNSTIFIILAKSGVSTRAPYPMYGVFSQKAYLRRLLQDASDFRSRR